MSKLEKLIAELCPDGVEYKNIDDTISSLTTGLNPRDNFVLNGDGYDKYYVTAKDIVDNNVFPSDKTALISTSIVQLINKRAKLDNDILLFSSTGTVGRVAYIERYTGGWSVSETIYVIKKKIGEISLKYLMYVLLSESSKSQYEPKISKGTVPHLKIVDFLKIKIPVPPLAIQEEIVRILDAFTELKKDLKAELKARKEQYEYYLNFLSDYANRADNRRMYFEDLYDVKNGLNKGKEYFGTGVPIVNFTDVYNNRWVTKEMLLGRVNASEKEISLCSAQKGDVFITRTSETQEDVGKVCVLLDDVENCVFSGFVLRARAKTTLLNPKFVSYYLSSYNARKEIIKRSGFTTRALTSGGRLSKLELPIPPIEEQNRIVSILDRFDKLCNDISEGIPAEIKTREKQYEYYRDLLLTFKPKGIEA